MTDLNDLLGDAGENQILHQRIEQLMEDKRQLRAVIKSLEDRCNRISDEREEARNARDTAEAKCRWIESVRPSKTASELAAALPPDVLMHPMPFPDRLNYAAKMIQHAYDVWTGKK